MEGLTGAAPVMDWSATDLPAAWQAFREHVTFMFDGPLSDSQEAQKCNYLMLWIGAKGREVYKTFDMTNDQKKVLGEYYRRFEAHVKPKTNRVYARYKFQSRVQAPDETFETFMTDLKLQARDCGFRDPDEMVRDRIVFGVKSSHVREKLIDKGSDLSLDTAGHNLPGIASQFAMHLGFTCDVISVMHRGDLYLLGRRYMANTVIPEINVVIPVLSTLDISCHSLQI